MIAETMTRRDRRRFLEKLILDDGCWGWVGAHFPSGYGAFQLHGRNVGAHRISYELFVAPIPDGLELDHLCRNRGCARPDHLEPVTRRENIMRGANHVARYAVATHCPQGHPYDEENTYRYPDGRRDCRTCAREARHRYQERQKAAA